MFKNEKESLAHSEVETVIAPSVRVEGDFVSAGNIRIEGSVSGSVDTKSDLLVGTAAEITADVKANNATISGTLHGNLRVAERLELTSTAHVYGDVEAQILTVEAGATIDGKLVIGGNAKNAVVAKAEAARVAMPEKNEESSVKETATPATAREKKIEELLQQ